MKAGLAELRRLRHYVVVEVGFVRRLGPKLLTHVKTRKLKPRFLVCFLNNNYKSTRARLQSTTRPHWGKLILPGEINAAVMALES